MDEPLGLELVDIQDSLFIQVQELSHQDIRDANVFHAQEWAYMEEYQVIGIDDTNDSYFLTHEDETWEMKLEHVLEEPKLVIEDLEPDSKGYKPYIPTILMSRCSYFPSFGDEEFVDDEI